MSKATKLTIHWHARQPDWCHICGRRSNATADIHGVHSSHIAAFLRVCADCADAIGRAARKENQT